jgi:hypothetical protein
MLPIILVLVAILMAVILYGHFLRMPLNSEVAWLLPEGEQSYWRWYILTLTYEVAP